MTDRKVVGIQKVTVNSVDSINVLDFEWDFRGPEGRDIVEPQFKPNSPKGTGVKEWDGKYLWFKLIHDTKSTIYDSYFSDIAKNTVIPSMSITLTLDDGDTEVWTFEASHVYLINKGPQRLQGEYDTQEHREGEYEFFCIGTVLITYP